jgi:cytochrome P450
MVGELSIAKAFERMLHLIWLEALQHPVNALTGGFLARNKLIDATKKAYKLTDEIIAVMGKEYQDKLDNTKDEDLGFSVLDLLVRHNRALPKEKRMTHVEIVQNLMNFQVAGIETTMATTEMNVLNLAYNPELQQEFYDRVVKNFDFSKAEDYNTYANHKTLNDFTKEALRLYGTAQFLFDRLVVKDVNIGKYRIYKGSRL